MWEGRRPFPLNPRGNCPSTPYNFTSRSRFSLFTSESFRGCTVAALDKTRGWLCRQPGLLSATPFALGCKDDEAPHGDLQKFLDRGDRPVHETQLFCGQDWDVCEYCGAECTLHIVCTHRHNHAVKVDEAASDNSGVDDRRPI